MRAATAGLFATSVVWESAMAGCPLAFKVITVAASSDIQRYQDRHGAMIERRQVMDWLAANGPVDELLAAPPAHVCFVEEIGARRAAQRALAI